MVSNADFLFRVPDVGGVLQQTSPVNLKIKEKIVLSHDSYLYKFELPDGLTFGCPLGAHVKFVADINGKSCKRSYTPVSDVLQQGTADFLIKIYRAG